MAKLTLKDRPKYSAMLQENCSNSKWTDEIRGNNITEVRKKLYARVKNTNWHKTASDPFGFFYEYGMTDYYHTGKKTWGIKKTLAYLTYDKRDGVIWWDPRENTGKQRRMINSDGTLGLTWEQYYKRRNSLYR